MRKIIMMAALIASIGAANANVKINLPAGTPDGVMVVTEGLIADQVKPRAERGEPVIDSVKYGNGNAVFDLKVNGPAQCVIALGDGQEAGRVLLFAAPTDNLTIDISSLSPLKYEVSGTPLMEGVSMLNAMANQIMDKYKAAVTSGDQAGAMSAVQEYTDFFGNFLSANADHPAAIYALLNLEGEDYLNAFATLPESQKSSILYPIAERQKSAVERQVESEKKLEAMQSGHVEAPNFTLKNLEGKDVSLSDFRGKWVIIDFWGSWCGWCIKGFPKLKDAYAQYEPELVIIGVDCNEPEANWRKGVEKYQLPWVNVYNPEGTSVLSDYGVQGFPTKVIVNPEGKIADITVGEDPSFFDKLAKLIYGK